MPDTYYVPSGYEHVQQTANEPAEVVVVQRAMAGEHVHTWSKDTGTMCVSGIEVVNIDGSDVRVPRMDKVERFTTCALGNKERF